MLTAVNGLDPFELPLLVGGSMTVWADGYSRHSEELIFSILADVDAHEQAGLDITGRAPRDGRRVVVTVARVPTSLLAGGWWRELPDSAAAAE